MTNYLWIISERVDPNEGFKVPRVQGVEGKQTVLSFGVRFLSSAKG